MKSVIICTIVCVIGCAPIRKPKPAHAPIYVRPGETVPMTPGKPVIFCPLADKERTVTVKPGQTITVYPDDRKINVLVKEETK